MIALHPDARAVLEAHAEMNAANIGDAPTLWRSAWSKAQAAQDAWRLSGSLIVDPTAPGNPAEAVLAVIMGDSEDGKVWLAEDAPAGLIHNIHRALDGADVAGVDPVAKEGT